MEKRGEVGEGGREREGGGGGEREREGERLWNLFLNQLRIHTFVYFSKSVSDEFNFQLKHIDCV